MAEPRRFLDPHADGDYDDSASDISISYLNPPPMPPNSSDVPAAPPPPPRMRRMSASMVTVSSKTVKLGFARRTLGILLMLVTILMWTASNFLASSIFADDSYSKPYFVTWLNVGFFSIFLLRPMAKKAWATACERISFLPDPPGDRGPAYSAVGTSSQIIKADDEDEDDYGDEDEAGSAGPSSARPTQGMFMDDSAVLSAFKQDGGDGASTGRLTARETIIIALPFSILWFVSNVFVSACLKYTSVASSTVLGATSSAFTLAFGAVLGAERFTLRKLAGVAVCLLGVVLISQVDLSGGSDEGRGSFPEKSASEMAIGDALALAAAIFYALYTILLKKRVGDESRLDVFTFFGYIGLFDVLLFWPGMVVGHFTGFEEFRLPPSGKIWWIVIINGCLSVVSDICWTYSMLLTSPLVIAVGVSLAIPMSLLGQMIINGQSSTVIYWIGSVIVVASFLIINHENKQEAEQADQAAEQADVSDSAPGAAPDGIDRV